MKKLKDKKKKETIKSDFETLEEEKFLEGKTETSVKVSKLKDKDISGISIRTGNKVSNNYTRWRKGTWLPSDTDAGSWLAKLGRILHRLFFKWYGKKVFISEEDLILQQNKLTFIQQQLLEEANKMREMEDNFNDAQEKKVLAKEAKGKRMEYETALKTFEEKIKKSVLEDKNIEEDLKSFIKNNRWLMGLDCEVRAKNKDIDNQAEIDLHIITSFGQNRIIEAKSPNKKLFKRKTKEGRLSITPELAEAFSEIISYMQKTDIYSNLLTEGTQKIMKPSGIILMDYALPKEEEQFLRHINYHLAPHVQIITYDMLIENARKELSLLEES